MLKKSHDGRLVVRLPKLRRGKHLLRVHYQGSSTVAASSSRKRALTLR